MTALQPANSNIQTRAAGLALLIVVAILASAIDLAVYLVLGRAEFPPATRTFIALLPLPGDITLIVMALRRIRGLDEFQKRIHFEAAVVAFLATGLAVFVYACLQRAGTVPDFDANLVWLFMAATYAIGYYVAVRHYR